MAAEALVCVGGGVTTVPSTRRGCLGSRVLSVGGDDITEAIARELDIDIDTAEDLKRRADTAADDPVVAQAGRLVAARVIPMVRRGSLKYSLAPDELGPDTGAAPCLPHCRFMQRLQQQLTSTCENAHPWDGPECRGYCPQRRRTGPDRATARGCNWPRPRRDADGQGCTPSNPRSMPTEVAVAQARKREAVLGATVAGGFLALLLIAYRIQGLRLNKARRENRATRAKQAALQKQVNDLRSVEESLTPNLRARQANSAGRRRGMDQTAPGGDPPCQATFG